MSAIQIDHPDGNHVLILHAENSAIIRIETHPTYPGWVEIGYTFHESPIMIDTDDEWDAFVEMVSLADTVQKAARAAREQYKKDYPE